MIHRRISSSIAKLLGTVIRGKAVKIAYILASYPYLTTTFVDREILAVQQMEIDLVLVSMRKPAPFAMRPEIKRLAEATKYLLPAPWPRLLQAHLRFILTQPRTYMTTLVYMLSRRHAGFGAWIRTLFYFLVGVWAAKVLEGHGINHVHAHFANRATAVAMVVSRLLGIPYSMFAHANDIYVSPIMLADKMEGAKFVATCTGYNKAHLERLYNDHTASKLHLIYHGLDLSKFDPARQLSRNGQRPLLLAVGQLREKKGFSYLINACRLLQDRGYDFSCEIIGGGPEHSRLEALIADLHLEGTVILHGPLPHSEVLTTYTLATLFVLPCIMAKDGDRDGIPNVLLEAMAMQVPVVSTQLSGIPEVIEDGLTGLLVPSEDKDALAQAMARLLENPDLRAELGREGRKRVEERFDIHKNIGRLVELFKE
jgi:glycosyltransferase involved in cell wall biosynthesis